MAYKWKDLSFESFADAANAWLYNWALEGGCPELINNIKMWIRADTAEEWKEMALDNVDAYHCGKCDLAIPAIQQKVVKQLLENIEKV